jgi:NitT/TauT family transport system ATP-binding protein
LALDNINLQVEEGEFVSIVGPSGCGKTTFINLCDGLLKPTAGHIDIDGVPVTGPGTDRGMVFQDSCLMPWRTVAKNVIFGLECQGLDNGEGQDRAKKNSSNWSACRDSKITIRTSSPAVCSSAAIWRARSPSIPKS